MDRIINFLNRTYWIDVNIMDNGTDGTEKAAELSFYSPAGENVVETVIYDGTEGDFIRALERLADNWDIDEHIKGLAPYLGINGVPNSFRELVSDAEEIKATLQAAAKGLREAVYSTGIEKLKTEPDCWSDVSLIAERLQEHTNNPGIDIKDELENALYQVKAMAQNKYNSDYWRVLYNILTQFSEME